MDMKTKPYPQHEEEPMILGEPAVAYQRTDPMMYDHWHRTKGRYTQVELNEMDEEWCRPFTMEELNRWMDEVEANDEADDLLTGEEVFAEMERKYPWLCK